MGHMIPYRDSTESLQLAFNGKTGKEGKKGKKDDDGKAKHQWTDKDFDTSDYVYTVRKPTPAPPRHSSDTSFPSARFDSPAPSLFRHTNEVDYNGDIIPALDQNMDIWGVDYTGYIHGMGKTVQELAEEQRKQEQEVLLANTEQPPRKARFFKRFYNKVVGHPNYKKHMVEDDASAANEKSFVVKRVCTTMPANVNIPDAEDESLQRYKQSLGIGGGGKDISDPNDPRTCIILSLTMETEGRDPVKIDLSEPGSEKRLKDTPFRIKEGAKFTMVATFKVQHEILSGLHYVQSVKRTGIRVSKDSEMIGSFAPNTDTQPFYEKRFHEEDAPSGMLARAKYNATSSFVDDDKKTHLSFDWAFEIAKTW